MRRMRCKTYYFFIAIATAAVAGIAGLIYLLFIKLKDLWHRRIHTIHSHTGSRLTDTKTHASMHTQYALVDSNEISEPHVERAQVWCRTMWHVQRTRGNISISLVHMGFHVHLSKVAAAVVILSFTNLPHKHFEATKNHKFCTQKTKNEIKKKRKNCRIRNWLISSSAVVPYMQIH